MQILHAPYARLKIFNYYTYEIYNLQNLAIIRNFYFNNNKLNGITQNMILFF
jgi:hypothetical protein